MKDIKCFMIEDTGQMSPFIDGVSSPIYRRVDTGEEVMMRTMPIGAMWYVRESSQQDYRPGPDGRTLFVNTPAGHWSPDSRASNCGLPEDNEHYCWVRHGVPPLVTVDKKGKTCQAGAGSILIGKYHGFLLNGYLTNC
jgi:hypothetical protein